MRYFYAENLQHDLKIHTLHACKHWFQNWLISCGYLAHLIALSDFEASLKMWIVDNRTWEHAVILHEQSPTSA